MAIGNLTRYMKVKAIPSSEQILTVSNPLNIIPKYVHVDCPKTSAAYLNAGYIHEVFLADGFYGVYCDTNGSDNSPRSTRANQVFTLPTAQQRFYLGDQEVSIYKSSGSVSGRWNTNTEYTVHIYA